MIERSIVLILGAGASKPYGFPLGRELVTKVSEDDSIGMRNLMAYMGVSVTDDEDFRRELRYSRRGSVDAFLEHRSSFTSAGIAAIAYFISQAERDDSLFRPGIPSDWYQYFFQLLFDDAGFHTVGNNRVSVLTYNYDRSFEYSLLHALSSSYGASLSACREVMMDIPVLHLHGQLGPLPDRFEELHEADLAMAARGIRIVSEAVDQDPVFGEARELIARAEEVVFLGFGYLPVNITRLLDGLEPRHYHGTSFGLTESEERRIRLTFANLGAEITFHRFDVLDFLRHRLEVFVRIK